MASHAEWYLAHPSTKPRHRTGSGVEVRAVIDAGGRHRHMLHGLAHIRAGENSRAYSRVILESSRRLCAYDRASLEETWRRMYGGGMYGGDHVGTTQVFYV